MKRKYYPEDLEAMRDQGMTWPEMARVYETTPSAVRVAWYKYRRRSNGQAHQRKHQGNDGLPVPHLPAGARPLSRYDCLAGGMPVSSVRRRNGRTWLMLR